MCVAAAAVAWQSCMYVAAAAVRDVSLQLCGVHAEACM